MFLTIYRLLLNFVILTKTTVMSHLQDTGVRYPRGSVKEDSIHLGYDVMSIGRELPTVLRNLLPTPSG